MIETEADQYSSSKYAIGSSESWVHSPNIWGLGEWTDKIDRYTKGKHKTDCTENKNMLHWYRTKRII